MFQAKSKQVIRHCAKINSCFNCWFDIGKIVAAGEKEAAIDLRFYIGAAIIIKRFIGGNFAVKIPNIKIITCFNIEQINTAAACFGQVR